MTLSAEKAVRPLLCLMAVGACLATTVLALRFPTISLQSGVVVLLGLALLAELWPVSIFRRGLRITFTLPFLLGIAVLAGPLNALLVDVAVTFLSALSLRYVNRRPVAPIWITMNVVVAMLSSALAGLTWILTHGSERALGWGLLFSVAAYVVVYAASNYGSIAVIDRWIYRRSISDDFLQNWRPNVQTVGLYVLVSFVVAFLTRAGLVPWAALTILPIAALRHALTAQAKLYDHYYETITALTMMLQRVHPYTHGHLKRVANIAEEVGLRLGLSAKRARLVHEAAILHDIGKIAVDEEILDKPGRLTDSEFEHIKLHAAFGAQILEPIEGFSPIVKWVRHHHERPDGTGYPDQLSGAEIPIESKIISVVDAFDAMTGGCDGKEKRCYRDPMTMAEALEELRRCSDTQFDRQVVEAFSSVVIGGRA